MSNPTFKPLKEKGKRVRWYNGRALIATGVGVICTFIGVGIGTSGSGDSASASTDPTSTVTVTAKPAPRPTVTVTAKAAPQPTATVTATRTVTAKPKVITKTVTAPAKPAKTITVTAKPKNDSGSGDTSESAPSGTAVFKVAGNAPGGVDITYGSDSDNRQGGSSLPWKNRLPVDDNADYYSVTAQLQGGGDINCSLTIDGVTGHGHASGGYNICQVELVQGLFGGWDVA